MSRSSSTNPLGRGHVRGNSFGPNFAPLPAQPSTSSSNTRSLSFSEASSRQMNLRGMQRLEARHAMEQTHFLANQARAQSVDMRLLDYVAPYDGNLECPICRCPLVDPVILSECDHCFCWDCIRQTWSGIHNPLGPKGDCPTCRTPAKLGPRSATSKILINILDDLIVKCPNSDEGCTSEVKRGEIQDHVSLYCGYAVVECSADSCNLPIRRKDVDKPCLHYGVSCLDCHEEMQTSILEVHWRNECTERRLNCQLCDQELFHRELDEHTKTECPAINIPCPGAAFGCTAQGRREESEAHAKNCTFARLAPIFTAQKQRLDEQEIAQKTMTRKLDVLQNGFAAMQSILYPPEPRIEMPGNNENHNPRQRSSTTSEVRGRRSEPASTSEEANSAIQSRSRDIPFPGFRDPFTSDFDLPLPPNSLLSASPTEPYASPLHHLLSMHENLRNEMSRMSAAMSEIDARLSMQSLNENMRTREEVTYLGAQLAGMARQLHWLTSERLQRQQGHVGTTGGNSTGSASASAGVGAAVQAASNVLRGSGMASGGNGMRRGLSEEGRTKL